MSNFGSFYWLTEGEKAVGGQEEKRGVETGAGKEKLVTDRLFIKVLPTHRSKCGAADVYSVRFYNVTLCFSSSSQSPSIIHSYFKHWFPWEEEWLYWKEKLN